MFFTWLFESKMTTQESNVFIVTRQAKRGS